MNDFFTYAEGELFIRLLLAHCLVDFILQTDKAVKAKQEKLFKSGSFRIHVALIGIATAIAIWQWNLQALLAVIGITITHLLIDAGKVQLTKKYAATTNDERGTDQAEHSLGPEMWLFILDQILHIAILIAAWLWLINGWTKFYHLFLNLAIGYKWLLRFLGYIVVVGPARYIVRIYVERWSPHIQQTNDGLPGAGDAIGNLERILVLTLVFIEQFTAIGFLVTAKSILRLIDKPEKREPAIENIQKRVDESSYSSRKHTEYVLIGTFLSYGLAIITGLVINGFLKF